MKKEKRNYYFVAGSICFLAVILNHQFRILSLIFGANIEALLSGALTGLGFLLEWIGLYHDTHDVSFMQRKKDLFSRNKKIQTSCKSK